MTSSSSPAVAALIVRGPMASDHYTPIHNSILRGGLPAQYVGVYAYIASHREGWRLSEAQIAQALRRGRHYVRQALSAMEAAGLLVRRQERRADGTYGAALWWVSDLAAQLRALGVDEATISRRVAEAAEECFRRSAPMSENLTSAVSSGNTLPEECFRRSEPMFDFPTSENRTPKEEQEEEEQEEEQSPPPTSPSPAVPAETAQGEEEEDRKPADAGLRDRAAQLLDAAQWPLGGRPSPVDHGRLVAWAARCLAAGHPDADVARELREAMTAQRPIGAAIARLRTLAGLSPRQTATGEANDTEPPTRREWELPPCEHDMPGGNLPLASGVVRCPMCRRAARRRDDVAEPPKLAALTAQAAIGKITTEETPD